MAGTIAENSAFGARRAAPHSNEHTVRDLLFPRQVASNSSTSAIDSSTSSSLSSSSTSSSIVGESSSSVLSSISSVAAGTSTTTPLTTPATTSTSAPAPTSDSFSTSTAAPGNPSTVLVTSLISVSATGSNGQDSSQTVVVTLTSNTAANQPATTSSSTSSAASSSTSDTSLPANGSGQNKGSDNGNGLSTGATTAIAVVIPVVVVAALLVLGLWLWRRRKQRKTAEDDRRKEMEDYGYNPNNDPTLPAAGAVGGSEMTEDHSGYRGWGGTQATSTGRKASTTLSGGMAGGLSDTTSQPGGYHSPNSPSTGGDANSGDALVGGARRETMESGDGVGALGAAPAAGVGRGVQRGPSNASSSYSAGGGSHNSGGDAPIPVEHGYGDEYNQNPYYQTGPYEGAGSYGAQPVVRDVQARRNTRIENPSARLQQGNSGIAQNF